MLFPIQNDGVVSNDFLDCWNMLMYKGAEFCGMNYIEFNLFIECIVKPGFILILLVIIYSNHIKIKHEKHIRKAR